MNWGRMRLLTSTKMHITRSDLRTMTFDEYHQAHCTLDALEAAEMGAVAEAKAGRDRSH